MQSNLTPTLDSQITVINATFSGRPDPQWHLTDEQTAALRRSIGSLQSTDEPFSLGQLPYGGFRVKGKIDSTKEVQVYVYKGIISIRDENDQEISRLKDPTYEIEKLLFDSAKAHLEAPVYQKAIEQFNKEANP